MFRRPPLQFALSIALAVAVLSIRPEWYADGRLGALLVGYAVVLSFVGVFNLLLAGSDALSRPENRVRPATPWADVAVYTATPWADVAVYTAGTAVLLWILVQAGGRQMALVIGLSAVLVGGAMFAFTRWTAARSRRAGPTSS